MFVPDDELFTIKLFYDGEMEGNCKNYTGGLVAYVDFCDSDQISLLEINSMLKECGARGGVINCGSNFQEPQWIKGYLS